MPRSQNHVVELPIAAASHKSLTDQALLGLCEWHAHLHTGPRRARSVSSMLLSAASSLCEWKQTNVG